MLLRWPGTRKWSPSCFCQWNKIQNSEYLWFKLFLFDRSHGKCTWSNWQFDRLKSTKHTSDLFHFIYFFIKSYKLLYHLNNRFIMQSIISTPKKLQYFNHQTLNVIIQPKKGRKRIDSFRDVSRDYLERTIKTLLREDKTRNKISNNLEN